MFYQLRWNPAICVPDAGPLCSVFQGEGAPPADQPEVNVAPAAPAPAPAPTPGVQQTVTVTVEEYEVHHVDHVLEEAPATETVVQHQPVVRQEVVVEQQPVVEVVQEEQTVVQVVEQPVVTTEAVLVTSERQVPVQQTVVEVVAVAEDGSEQVVSAEVRAETERDGLTETGTAEPDRLETAGEEQSDSSPPPQDQSDQGVSTLSHLWPSPHPPHTQW